ncbi:MAG: nucleotidyltransferase family protein [Nitrospinota bacterium]
MEAIVLAGGKGSRLSSVVNDAPKPMAEINGKPFLEHLLYFLTGSGFTRFILSIGYMGEKIEEFFETHRLKENIVFSKESKPLGTAGAIKLAETRLTSPCFFVINGDSFAEVDFDYMRKRAIERKANAVISLLRIQKPDRYGLVTLGEGGSVIEFGEKKQGLQTGFINSGVYCLQKEMLKMIEPNTAVSLERDIFPKLIGQRFFGVPFEGRFIDIGIPKDYFRAQDFFKQSPEPSRKGIDDYSI